MQSRAPLQPGPLCRARARLTEEPGIHPKWGPGPGTRALVEPSQRLSELHLSLWGLQGQKRVAEGRRELGIPCLGGRRGTSSMSNLQWSGLVVALGSASPSSEGSSPGPPTPDWTLVK